MHTPRPPLLSTITPAAFTQFNQFVLCKLLPDLKKPGKFTKIPCDSRGITVSAHDPASWLSAADALRLSHATGFGIGFALTDHDPFWAIDLDNAVSFGAWSPQAAELLQRFAGAAVEVSFSGTGLHIFGAGTIPEHRSVRTLPGGKIEFYTSGRFILLTGNGAMGRADLDFSAHMPAFLDAYQLRPDPVNPAVLPQADGQPRPGTTGVQYSDTELLDIMRNMRGSAAQTFGNRATPWQLFSGDAAALARIWPEQGRADGAGFDRSAADAALMQHLAFFTGSHVPRMAWLFSQSALYRPDRYEGAGAYRLDRIINHAVGSTTQFYDRPRPGAAPGAPGAAPREIDPDDFAPRAEHAIPPRPFIFGKHYIRRETGLTAAPGAAGKTALVITEVLSMVSGRRLLYDTPKQPLNVVYFGEDTADELERRFVAAMKQHQIHVGETQGRLMVRSLRDTPLQFVRRNGFGVERNEADIAAVKTLLQRRRADVVIFDTAKKIHAVDENNNGDMDAFIMVMNEIAGACDCAVELLAHTKKQSIYSGERTIEDTRGARSQLDAVRSARLVSKMTAGEADELNMDRSTAWQYIRVGSAKENMTPPADASEWMKLASVMLNNRNDGARDNAGPDNLQVVIPFTPPQPLDSVTSSQMTEIKQAIAIDIPREDARSKTWVGYTIAGVLGIDEGDKKRLHAIIREMMRAGFIEAYEATDDNRVKRRYIRTTREAGV